ncbi:nitroreductase family deazaflavin-dependent oxidoreductase [Amycolatopsis sp. NPDC051758]|uniref:nitroreductase family deazaflavin-dependent oxidoreductase n=1 Tax=Amycolatopsis sp. NPDC051758 TaxID=3363935 RepID=UPI0037965642
MTAVSKAEIRDRNLQMLNRIRARDPQSHREGYYALRVLTVAGRTSGEPRTVPIALMQLDGIQYVCSPDRRRDWVRNLLAAGRCTVEPDEHELRDALLVEDASGAAAVAGYLGRLPRVSDEWPFPGDAPPEQVLPFMGQIAVFQLCVPA